MSAEKGGSVLGDGEHRALRNIFEYVIVLDLVPGCRIELANSLEDALDDFRSGNGLKNTLVVEIAPVDEQLVLYSTYIV